MFKMNSTKKIKSNETNRNPIFQMHKYWGKKPFDELNRVVTKYTLKNDLVLDPFAGFGGLGVECVLTGRNVIVNDLNPCANFISKNILESDVNIEKTKKLFLELKQKYSDFENEWYSYENKKILTILRDRTDKPLAIKFDKNQGSINLDETNQEKFLSKENAWNIKTWIPKEFLIHNSRICAKKGMKISDLFSKRALICQSYLFSLICDLPDSNEKELLKLAFTSNLANASKLVPPIKSRGSMSQGAWMTGFYIGETYLENNVFHYFENRVNKVIKGKEYYLNELKKIGNPGSFKITGFDAKNLRIPDNSIDFVFTDFPYGDTVPYFEQSQLWNAWLENKVDYDNEIVISDSDERNKKIDDFQKDIHQSINEIFRVLKDDKFFVFTFHSLDGNEWISITKALYDNGFEFVECKHLSQKTLPPRQLNRINSIKGDIVAIYKKTKHHDSHRMNNFLDNIRINVEKNTSYNKLYDTNFLIELCVSSLLQSSAEVCTLNFIDIMSDYFAYDEENKKWKRITMN